MSLTRRARPASLLNKHRSSSYVGEAVRAPVTGRRKKGSSCTSNEHSPSQPPSRSRLPWRPAGPARARVPQSKASGGFGDCKVTSKANSISIKPAKAGTLTVETTLPAQGWWNGTTPESIKSGYEYCMAADLANMAGLSSVTVKNVSFDQLVAGHTNDFDIALAEISITAERAKVVDFSKPYFDSNIGVLVKKDSDVTEDNINDEEVRGVLRHDVGRLHPERAEVRRRRSTRTRQTLYQGVLSGQVDADFLDTAIVLAEAKATDGKLEGRRAVQDR